MPEGYEAGNPDSMCLNYRTNISQYLEIFSVIRCYCLPIKGIESEIADLRQHFLYAFLHSKIILKFFLGGAPILHPG